MEPDLEKKQCGRGVRMAHTFPDDNSVGAVPFPKSRKSREGESALAGAGGAVGGSGGRGKRGQMVDPV